MSILVDILSGISLLIGAVFCLIGAIGLLRMPDFYTRVHAASVTETLGVAFILIGLMLQAGFTLITVKLLLIGILIFFASPTASHALTRAALLRGVSAKLDKEAGETSSKH